MGQDTGTLAQPILSPSPNSNTAQRSLTNRHRQTTEGTSGGVVPSTQESDTVDNLEEKMYYGHGTSADSKGTVVGTSHPDGGNGDTSQVE